MTWTTEIVRSIRQIDPPEWDRLVHGQPFADWNWLAVTEAVLVDHQPRYVLLRRDGNLCAGVVCVLQNHFQSPVLQSSLGGYIYRSPGLRCGVPISYDPGLFLGSDNRTGDLLPALMQGIQTLVRQEHISFYTIDHLLPAGSIWNFLQLQGYHRIEHLPEVYLDIAWTSFEDYLSSLSKKKRTEYGRVRGHLEQENILIEVADLQKEDEGLLQHLINNVFQRHKEPNPYHAEVLRKVSTLMGEDFKLIVARQAGQTIGCVVLVRSGNDWLAKWLGLDYERAFNTGTYYGLIAACVRQAIQAGGKRLRLGATAYQTKQHFGVAMEDRIGAFAFRNPAIHYLAGKALRLAARLEIPWPIAESKKEKKKVDLK